MANPVYPVEAPTRTPRRGGIRSVAEFRTDNRMALGGTLVYTSPGCSLVVGSVALCYPTQVQAPKTGNGVDNLESSSVFGGYYGVTCWLDGEDYDARAREGLAWSEDRRIEAVINAYLLGLASAGSADTITGAIAAAEQHADANYPGEPVILLNRADAVIAFAEGAIDADKEGNLWTPNGTRVVASSAITSGTVSATGALTIYQSEVVVTRVQDLELNTELAIAERAYAFLADCNYAARFSVTAP